MNEMSYANTVSITVTASNVTLQNLEISGKVNDGASGQNSAGNDLEYATNASGAWFYQTVDSSNAGRAASLTLVRVVASISAKRAAKRFMPRPRVPRSAWPRERRFPLKRDQLQKARVSPLHECCHATKHKTEP